MGKNWLIRTKSNHILGPVSKEKVLELYQNGSIKQDDEICSGNGYWFFIRESDLVEKYLIGNASQSFNPISEAKDVLTSADPTTSESRGREDITMVGAFDFKRIQSGAATAEKPQTGAAGKKKLKTETLPNQASTRANPKQNWVKYLGIVIFLLLFSIIYFRKSIMKDFFGSGSTKSTLKTFILPEAHAQDDSSGKKKSS